MRRLQWYNTQIFQHRLIQIIGIYRHFETGGTGGTGGCHQGSFCSVIVILWRHLCIFRLLIEHYWSDWWLIIPPFCILSHCVIADDARFCPKCWWWNIVSAPVVHGMTRVWDQNNPPCDTATPWLYMTRVLMMPITLPGSHYSQQFSSLICQNYVAAGLSSAHTAVLQCIGNVNRTPDKGDFEITINLKLQQEGCCTKHTKRLPLSHIFREGGTFNISIDLSLHLFSGIRPLPPLLGGNCVFPVWWNFVLEISSKLESWDHGHFLLAGCHRELRGNLTQKEWTVAPLWLRLTELLQ